MGDHHKLVFLNNPSLSSLSDVLQVTESVLEEDPIGPVKELKFGTWTFNFSITESYFFLTGSEHPASVTFLSLQAAILRHVIFFVLGPKPDYNK
jgi:hypothetical protein